MIAFTRIPGQMGCDATVEKPPYDNWFASRGVREADWDELMTGVIEPVNSYAANQPCYIAVTLITCGLCGWECQLCEGCSIPQKIQYALDFHNSKYPNVKGSISQAPPGLVFRGPAAVVSAEVTATIIRPGGQARQAGGGADAEETLVKLKSMLSKGLITQAEYDGKKAEILAAM